MNKMMKRRIKSTTKWTKQWTLDGERDGVYCTFDYALYLTTNVFREAREQEELQKHRAERPKIQQQFADLKRGLSAVSDAEWESIPEVGNLTRKKRRKEERTYAVPDSVLVGDRTKNEYENALDDKQQQVREVSSRCHAVYTELS